MPVARREIKSLGLSLPLLGFGCMRLPVTDEGKIDRNRTKQMFKTAFDSGVNYFDTAYMYHGGESELVLGELLKDYPRESYSVATKLPMMKVKTKADAIDCFEEQLKKLGVEYFDFYLVHAVDRQRLARFKQEDIYSFLLEKKKQGVIKRLGFSFHDTPDVLKDALDSFEWDFVQIQLNYLDWKLQDAKGQYELLTERNIPVVVMEPIRGGFLANLPDDVAAFLKNYAPDRSIASWALRWVASLPNVAVVLSGMSTEEQLDDNLKTFAEDVALSKEEHKLIQTAVEMLESKKSVPCTGCRYCADCPSGVDIPKIFELYNRHILYHEGFRVWTTYCNIMPKESLATSCTECGWCETQCPQQIKIIDQLKVAHKALTSIKD